MELDNRPLIGFKNAILTQNNTILELSGEEDLKVNVVDIINQCWETGKIELEWTEATL